MINSSPNKINCPKCGHSDWYVLGRHRTCRPCNAASQRRYAERQRLGREAERQSRPVRPLYASLALTEPVAAVRRRRRSSCVHGHRYTAASTAWQTDSRGRQYRQCRTCHRDRQRERYGMGTADSLAMLLGEAANGTERH